MIPTVMGALMLLTAAGCDNPKGIDYKHGTIELAFKRGDGLADNPFGGTTVVEVNLNYETCLTDFYKANPNWEINGVDGEAVFGTKDLGGEGWQDELCERGTIDCSVIRFDQTIDTNAPSFLKVVYAITDGAAIENSTLHFGPLPKASLAACEAGSLPTVRVASNGAVRGLSGSPPEGKVLWQIQKFNPGSAKTDQGASIDISAELTP